MLIKLKIYCLFIAEYYIHSINNIFIILHKFKLEFILILNKTI